jgi:hypothetical protein
MRNIIKRHLQDDIPIQRQGNHHDLRLRRMKNSSLHDKQGIEPRIRLITGAVITPNPERLLTYILEPLPTKTNETHRYFPLLNSSLPFSP